MFQSAAGEPPFQFFPISSQTGVISFTITIHNEKIRARPTCAPIGDPKRAAVARLWGKSPLHQEHLNLNRVGLPSGLGAKRQEAKHRE